MISFEKFNGELNYYTGISKKTGNNNWNQDSAQNSFIELIENCSLTPNQVEALSSAMIRNNAVLDMEPSKNMSVEKFHSVIKVRKLEEKGKTI